MMNEFEDYKHNIDINSDTNIHAIYTDHKILFNNSLHYVKKSREFCSGQDDANNKSNLDSNRSNGKLLWTDLDAQADYLKFKPISYLVLGKPGVGSYSVGEAISEKFSCVHLCPEKVIQDECNQKSVTGQCLDFNLRHNNVLKANYILQLIKQKIYSPCIKHRGYVISGLPLVTANQDSHYYINSLYIEESIACVQEIILELFSKIEQSSQSVKEENELVEEENVLEETNEREENDLKTCLNTCENVIVNNVSIMVTKLSVLFDQMGFLFEEPVKPDVIIYLMGSDEDVISKRSQKFFDHSNNLCIQVPFQSKLPSLHGWPTPYQSDIFNVYQYDETEFENTKYNCKQLINTKEKCIHQLCNFKDYVESYIEKKIKDYDPAYVIRLNSCTSICDMMHNVIQRIQYMPTNSVVIPKPFKINNDDGEDQAPEDTEEFWRLVCDVKVDDSGSIGFKRKPSLWFDRCPVELKYGRTIQGVTKYAATFMKHVYLMSSLQHLNSFCNNPRPFLKIENLDPKCRVAVVGTPYSGKSMISECLSWVFDAPILSYDLLLAEQQKHKFNIYANRILLELSDKIMATRLQIWQNLEKVRLSQLRRWGNQLHDRLQDYLTLSQKSEAKSKKLKSMKQKLENVIPFLNDKKTCKQALRNRSILFEYAPPDLLQVNPEPTIPILGDADVMQAIDVYIIEHDLQTEILPTPEELLQDICKFCISQDEKIRQSTNSEKLYGNWIIDGLPASPVYWNILIDMDLLPDYTIALLENREFTHELLDVYRKVQRFQKIHSERFVLVNDPFILKKRLTKTVETMAMQQNIQIIVFDIINNVLQTLDNRDTVIDDEVKKFTDSITKFREDWDNIKLQLEEHFKAYINIELAEFSDLQILEETLFKLRLAYNLPCFPPGDEEELIEQNENIGIEDRLTLNDPQLMCETNNYCLVTFLTSSVLWKGKQDFSIKYDSKLHLFCKEECMESFCKDPTKYRLYVEPFKRIPPLRICLTGCIGSGKTTLSKNLGKELGLPHIDFSEIVNELLIPRHIKKVGREYENIFTDMSIDDATVTDITTFNEMEHKEAFIVNENELRRIVFNYFEIGTPLPTEMLQNLFQKLWFEEPYKSLGFILDGFPRIPDDVDGMMDCFCVPEFILQLETITETALDRMIPKMFNKWEFQLAEAQNIHELKIQVARQERLDLITKEIVIKLIWEAIVDSVFYIEPIAAPIWEPAKDPSLESIDSEFVDPDIMKAYSEIAVLYPEIVNDRIWETPEEAHERIESRIQAIYDMENDCLGSIVDILVENNIPTVAVSGDDNVNKVFQNALMKLKQVRNKTESFFEQTFVITTDTAESLLCEGMYLLSKFYRMCPVHFYENSSTVISPYLVSKSVDDVFPVIHRSYIYFICTRTNLQKFRGNPMKYINNIQIEVFSYFPIRVAVVGPPKCGKSTLTSKFVEKYGLLPISRGLAIRYILYILWWTELANKMTKCITKGKTISYDLVVEAVKAVAFDHRAMTHGIIFDGFPYDAPEAMLLSKIGLYPLVLFDIQTMEKKVLKNACDEIHYDIFKTTPPHSDSLVKFRFNHWKHRKNNLRDWIQEDYQNGFTIDGDESKWHCWNYANNFIAIITSKIHDYLVNRHHKSVPVDDLGVSSILAETRSSDIKNLCPVCYSENTIRQVGFTTNRKGLVQYKGIFYWVCDEHRKIFLNNPNAYTSFGSVILPEVPAAISHIDMTLVYENGICIVTYAENLPAQIIRTGVSKYAASYNKKIYLFCTPDCRKRFMEKPHLYYDISVLKDTKSLSKVSLSKLPNLGYLEQTLGNILTSACCHLNVLRPKYPGLSIQVSGLIYLALYLKIHNSQISPTYLPVFNKQLKVYEVRCKLVKDLGLRLRAMTNPFIEYPHFCHIESSLNTVVKSSSSASEMSVNKIICTCCKCHVDSKSVPLNKDDVCICCKCDDSSISFTFFKYNKCDCLMHKGSFS